MELIISLLCGAVGGNLGGLILKKFSLGTLWNSVAGIVGGGIGSQLLGGTLGGGIPDQLGSGAIGGIVVMLIVGLVKKLMSK
jgi:uncharacterized membrane protein YeaQ/YmgE (transglycosylase-associated protein family)